MTFYLSLGSNLENKSQNLLKARLLIEKRVGKIIAVSSEYTTEPVGFESKNLFINQAIAVETELTPLTVLDITSDIEKTLGRKEKSTVPYKDRIIDIDLLLAENVIVNSERLTLPHPQMHSRNFVLEPLCEIAPNLIHPVYNKTIKELLSQLTLNFSPFPRTVSMQTSGS